MQIKNLIVIISVLVLILLTISGLASPGVFEPEKKSSIQSDYITVVRFNDGFVTASNNGLLDWVSNTGTITKSETFSELKLNSLLVIDQQIIVAGNDGLMLIGSEPESFKTIDSGTDRSINSLAFFRGKVIAAADGGEISVGNASGLFKAIQLDLKGNIVSVSANTTACYGVTDKGEIIHSRDGINWHVFDFNKMYQDYYKTCQFTKVLATDKQISIIGIQDDEMPVMFYSSGGTVWTQRNLGYTDNEGMPSLLNTNLNDIYYDETKDRFILVCNQGQMMTIPSCSHCNKLFEVSSTNLISISGNENSIVVVGENGYLKTERIDYF